MSISWKVGFDPFWLSIIPVELGELATSSSRFLLGQSTTKVDFGEGDSPLTAEGKFYWEDILDQMLPFLLHYHCAGIYATDMQASALSTCRFEHL
ncbi:MAG: hypothetical protein AB7H80_13430 [Candidatus Kapaibacterium sp.]